MQHCPSEPRWKFVETKTRYHADRRETDAILRPSSGMNSVPSEQMGPSVSTATGTKVTARGKSAYLRFFASAANSAAAPAVCTVLFRCDSASESDTVASQARQRPSDHGIMVSPSGRRSSELVKPLGSKTAGTPALTSARCM